MPLDLQLPIYPDEVDIGEDILKSSLISSLAQISLVEPFEISEGVQKLVASERQSVDLFYMQSILVSSVWNGNDELFLPSELWYSRNTAKDKPFNYEHVGDDIIGHMTNGYVIDDSGKIIASNTKVEDLPETIHILNQAVLYRYWEDEKLQERMVSILDEIKENKWFVSVECLLPDFDYALKDKNGNLEIISRNKKTAFLTKHLRLFGGSGLFEGKRLARVPRNFIISGKGLVRTPANKDSVIIAKQLFISDEKNNLVYKSSDDLNTKAIKMNETKEQEYQLQIKTLNESLVKLQASISEGELSKIKVELDGLKKDNDAKVQEVAVLKASVEKLHTDNVELAKAHDKLIEEKNGLQNQLDEIAIQNKVQSRIQAAKAVYTNDEDAKRFVDSTDKLTEEAFKNFLDWSKSFMSANSEVKTKTETEVVVNKEEVIKAAQIITEPNLTVTVVDKKAEANKLQESIATYLTKNYIKSGVQKFKTQDK